MRFRTILADPPWIFTKFSEKGFEGRGQRKHYARLSLSDLCTLPVSDVAAADAALLLWATWPTLVQAHRVIDAWGFTFKTGVPWIKTTRDGAPRFITGYHARCGSEPLLIATRGTGVCPALGQQPEGVIFSPVGRHSAKPDAQYDFAEAYGGPYLEMFARPDGGLFPPREGWTRIGNEMTGRDIATDLRILAETEK